jgi:hypothetical protein
MPTGNRHNEGKNFLPLDGGGGVLKVFTFKIMVSYVRTPVPSSEDSLDLLARGDYNLTTSQESGNVYGIAT